MSRNITILYNIKFEESIEMIKKKEEKKDKYEVWQKSTSFYISWRFFTSYVLRF